MPLPPLTNPTFPALDLVTVTPSDVTTYQPALRQLYIGTSGDLTVITDQNTTIVFKNLFSGTIIGPFYIKQVKATGTTASDIVGFV